jgi:hypothetical protein
MGHFYGEIQGNRGEATRMGTKKSGFRAHIRGWHIGVRVRLHVDDDGNDVIEVYRTGGSSSSWDETHIATLMEGD